MGIAPQSLLDLQRKSVHAAPHVGPPHRKPHPNPARNRDHRPDTAFATAAARSGAVEAAKVAYRRASDEGLALTETRFASLNARADAVAQALIDAIVEQQEEEAA